MACRITDDVINALQHCRLKAYFRLRGEEGAPCGYEKLLIEQRANARRKAIEKIRHEYSETEVATGLNLSLAKLRLSLALFWTMIAMQSSSMPFARPMAPHRSETSNINR